MKKAILKNVTFLETGNGKWQMVGDVYGHPDFEEGKRVHTSSIQKIITRNTEYTIEPNDID